MYRRPWPRRTPRTDTTVTVMVTTLNEVHRVGPCLDGLMQQQEPLLEVLVVDSRSTDGTRELVEAASKRDPRIRLVTDEPLPPGWVGKVWALENGLREARGEWVLGIDADTVPAPGLVGAVIDAVEQDGYDVASFSPQFREVFKVLPVHRRAIAVQQPCPRQHPWTCIDAADQRKARCHEAECADQGPRRGLFQPIPCDHDQHLCAPGLGQRT